MRRTRIRKPRRWTRMKSLPASNQPSNQLLQGSRVPPQEVQPLLQPRQRAFLKWSLSERIKSPKWTKCKTFKTRLWSMLWQKTWLLLALQPWSRLPKFFSSQLSLRLPRISLKAQFPSPSTTPHLTLKNSRKRKKSKFKVMLIFSKPQSSKLILIKSKSNKICNIKMKLKRRRRKWLRISSLSKRILRKTRKSFLSSRSLVVKMWRSSSHKLVNLKRS